MTYPDADHVAGLNEVLEMYEVERIYLNGGASDTQTFSNFIFGVAIEGAEVNVLTRGDVISLGDLEVQVVHPGALTGDSNVASMALLLDCGEVEILLTGDAETPSEVEILQAGMLSDIDVLKVGHHGSRSSTSQSFLGTLKPEVGIISAGLDSQYRHPHPEVLERLNAADIEIWHTDVSENDDTVLLTFDCRTFGLERFDDSIKSESFGVHKSDRDSDDIGSDEDKYADRNGISDVLAHPGC